jgi:hypothetical protein
MKKLLVLSLAVVMVVAFTLPASAFESVFGGYWRTRAFTQQNFSGDEDRRGPNSTSNTGRNDLSRTDTRTRLYYTAILNDNLKLINQFEFNAVWGDADGGDIGADGDTMRIRSSHIDATMGAVRMTLGIQPLELGRGQIISDQMSGVVLSTKMGDHLIPFTWFKVNEGGTALNSEDSDVFALYPVFNFGENFSLNPFVAYGYSRDGDRGAANAFSTYGANAGTGPGTEDPATPDFAVDDGINVYWVGANADMTFGSWNLWATAIYVGGELESEDTGDVDVKAWTAAVGASVPLGPASLHGQFLYASGDDDDEDGDYEAYFGVDGAGAGWSYYWAEIMGNGRFDAQSSAGADANPSNLWFANIGASIKPMEKLSLTGDLWYAAHPEDDLVTDEKELGLEVDLVATYQLVEGLSIDLVGAYLFADDATALDDDGNDDDPWEVGTRLQLSF